MGLWIQTTGLVFAAVCGVGAGAVFSRARKHYWVVGYALPMTLIGMLLLARYCSWLSFTPPLSWVVAGRARFVIYAFVACMGLTAPLSRLPYRFEKAIVATMMVLIVTCFSVIPFVAPAFARDTLASLTTRLDHDGICLQSTHYTCGPAAAVTALGELGLPANEGELAVLAYSSPITGTLPSCLATALEGKYAKQGLECRYRGFDSVSQLNTGGITLAVVRDAFLYDHCIAVLNISEDNVIVADPALGKMAIPLDEFRKMWRFAGIVLKRNAAGRT